MEDEPEPDEWQYGHQRHLFIGSLGWNNENIYLHPKQERLPRAIGSLAVRSKEVAYDGEW